MLFWDAEKKIDALGTSHLHLTITEFTVAQKKNKEKKIWPLSKS